MRNLIDELYNKYRLYFFRETLSKSEEGEETSLTMVESLSLECIQALGEPTVQEFAKMMGISAPNAAYKVNSLIQKGYIEKLQSENDHREYHLRPTGQYQERSKVQKTYADTLEDRCRKRFTEEELEQFKRMAEIIVTELMPELDKERFCKKHAAQASPGGESRNG